MFKGNTSKRPKNAETDATVSWLSNLLRVSFVLQDLRWLRLTPSFSSPDHFSLSTRLASSIVRYFLLLR